MLRNQFNWFLGPPPPFEVISTKIDSGIVEWCLDPDSQRVAPLNSCTGQEFYSAVFRHWHECTEPTLYHLIYPLEAITVHYFEVRRGWKLVNTHLLRACHIWDAPTGDTLVRDGVPSYRFQAATLFFLGSIEGATCDEVHSWVENVRDEIDVEIEVTTDRQMFMVYMLDYSLEWSENASEALKRTAPEGVVCH